jgi:hypothetical protein
LAAGKPLPALQIINMQLTAAIHANRGEQGPACLAESGWSADRMKKEALHSGKEMTLKLCVPGPLNCPSPRLAHWHTCSRGG